MSYLEQQDFQSLEEFPLLATPSHTKNERIIDILSKIWNKAEGSADRKGNADSKCNADHKGNADSKGTADSKGDYTAEELEQDYTEVCLLLRQELNPEIRSLAYNLIGHMRDRYHGKGSRETSYSMVYIWYCFMDKNEALSMITSFVKTKIGCWKDMKYICAYIWNKTDSNSHPIIDHCISLSIHQLMKDYLVFCKKTEEKISNVAKWIPRESSAYHWVYEKMWKHWMLCNYPYLLKNARAHNKGRQIFRKWLSALNAHLETKEIKETQKKWNEIPVSKMSYMNLWKLALSKDIYRKDHTIETKDKKNAFKNNARFHILTQCQGNNTISLDEYVKMGCMILDDEECDPMRISLINYLWKTQVESGAKLEAVIPILNIYVDNDEVYSSSMNSQICGAIGISCMIAQKSKIPNRILLAHPYIQQPQLLILGDQCTFIDMLREVRKAIHIQLEIQNERELSTAVATAEVATAEVAKTVATRTSVASTASRTSIDICFQQINEVIMTTGIDPKKILTVIVSNVPINISSYQVLLGGQHIVLWNTGNHRYNNFDSRRNQRIHLTGTNPKAVNHLSALSASIESGMILRTCDIATHALHKKY